MNNQIDQRISNGIVIPIGFSPEGSSLLSVKSKIFREKLKMTEKEIIVYNEKSPSDESEGLFR